MSDEPEDVFEVVQIDDPDGFLRAAAPVMRPRDPQRSVFRDRAARTAARPLAPGDELTRELIYRDEVWERDQGVCQICMTPIPDAGGRRGRLAFVIDHVDPAGDHVLSNVRAAHAFCNGSKGVDEYDPEVMVARARLARALADVNPHESMRRTAQLIDAELTQRRVVRFALLHRLTGGRWGSIARYSNAEEYMVEVRRWAHRLDEEVDRYMTWLAER